MSMLCPCGQPEEYQSCCEIIHTNISNALTSEQLMRSRYTAFTKGMGDYLLLSHHSTTRPTEKMSEIIQWANSVSWERLEILNTTKGQDKGMVEFKAHFKQGGKADFILENSQFVKENGHWVYLGFA
tara:strand:- start:2869 stop:3249 length:381 start_codon:yes stop_codon:yes gene_type:complete